MKDLQQKIEQSSEILKLLINNANHDQVYSMINYLLFLTADFVNIHKQMLSDIVDEPTGLMMKATTLRVLRHMIKEIKKL